MNDSVRTGDHLPDFWILAFGYHSAGLKKDPKSFDCSDNPPSSELSVNRRILSNEGPNRFDVTNRLR